MRVDVSLVTPAVCAVIRGAIDPVPVGQGVLPNPDASLEDNMEGLEQGMVVVQQVNAGNKNLTPGFGGGSDQARIIRYMATGFGASPEHAETIRAAAVNVVLGGDSDGWTFDIPIAGHEIMFREFYSDGTPERINEIYVSRGLFDIWVQAV